MAYPDNLLKPGERKILDLRPHWVALTVPSLVTAGFFGLIILAVWIIPGSGVLGALRWVVVIGSIVMWAVLAGWRFLRWRSTEFVLTSDRVIARHGVFAKTSRDIPLGKINDVTFTQSVIERILKSGNLIIRSAGHDAGNRFRFIRDPESVHNQIYQAMEAEEDETKQVSLDPSQLASLQQPPPPDIPGQIAKLAELRDQGALSDAEFEAKKADLLGRM